MKIYTKGGDQGETGLLGGDRVSKANKRIQLYGEIDELNSWIGVLISFVTNEHKYAWHLERIQNQLFDLGSLCACPEEQVSIFKLKSITLEQIKEIEELIDELNTGLPELKNFILPGGDKAASFAHICRVTTRKVERLLVEWLGETSENFSEQALPYLNRLSDFFFIFSRYLNNEVNQPEKIWKP